MSESQKRGRFIVFEGIDGCGKTTQINLLKEYLESLGKKVFITGEPTPSLTGGMLRDALGGVNKKTPCEMAAMFLLDRIFHNVNPVYGIEKMLSDGYDVICDRYYYSSLAYQGSETDFEWVKTMNLSCPDIRTPDACIFLDLSPKESLRRINIGRVGKEIYETEEKLTVFRNRFFQIFSLLEKTDRIIVISADGSIGDVALKIQQAYAGLESVL